MRNLLFSYLFSYLFSFFLSNFVFSFLFRIGFIFSKSSNRVEVITSVRVYQTGKVVSTVLNTVAVLPFFVVSNTSLTFGKDGCFVINVLNIVFQSFNFFFSLGLWLLVFFSNFCCDDFCFNQEVVSIQESTTR